MRRTGTTAHAILGLLALRPAWSTYELSQQLRRNMRFFWPRAESRIYADAILDVGRRVAAEYPTSTEPFQDQVHLRALVFDFLSNQP